MRIFIAYLFCCLSLLSCQSRSTSKDNSKEIAENDSIRFPVTIDFERQVDNIKPFALSEIATDIEYIPLETKANSLIGNIFSNISITNEYIFVNGGLSGLYQFDRTGKFIRSISKKGQGPGEYVTISSFFVNENLKRLYILSSHTWKILEYDFDGNLIQEIHTPKDIRYLGQISDTLFVSYQHNANGKVKDKLYLYNTNGKLLKTYPHSNSFDAEHGRMIGAPYDREIYMLDNKVRHKEFYNDTLFTITENHLIPEYVISLGKYAIPPEKRFERIVGGHNQFMQLASSYFRINVIESPQHLFLSYLTWEFTRQEKKRLCIYNKTTGECFTPKDYEITDDIKHIYSFHPENYISNQLIGIISPIDLLELDNERSKWREDPKLKSINEDSNPIVAIVTLK